LTGSTAIEVVELAKRYRLGANPAAYTTLRETVATRVRRSAPEPEKTFVWALRDVSFEVGESEVLGVIGRNGAGKSTLLKVLARITRPTIGVTRTRGRVGALLEVGTGFHPELTGNENIYLNGTILGMTRREIRRRYDEIVEFAGVERFLDTPLKRYSSGMYLRLAFAVAAHLEPEILLVDEVLAVGDADFQQRCLGKMEDLRSGGRTIVFVSHNLGAISQLCHRCVWLDRGKVLEIGPSEMIVDRYLRSVGKTGEDAVARLPELGKPVDVQSIALTTDEGAALEAPRRDQPFAIRLDLLAHERVNGVDVAVYVRDRRGIQLLCEKWSDTGQRISCSAPPARYTLTLSVPPTLAPGEYLIGVWVGTDHEEFLYQEVLPFRVLPLPNDLREAVDRKRVVQPRVDWRLEEVPSGSLDGLGVERVGGEGS
jgi:ABC-type polysaccharide/polyol phosphate transport system ATPase subunit